MPERIIQFGTGAFLRGFASFFVEEANRQGREAGSCVVIGSTGSGRVDRLNSQDGLYTLAVRGREEGATVDETKLITCVSRAISSRDNWDDVLALARRPELQLIISNTTEVGIAYDPADRLDNDPPASFPGKLTALLYERARAFEFDSARGLIILPCELIEGNGDRLKEIVARLAREWGFDARFGEWLHAANRFCNTLVDRIVPGAPEPDQRESLETRMGYSDALLTVAEPYRLWAIEGIQPDDAFALRGVDPAIVLTDDLRPYRERKVRILNGAHTISVPTALLMGLATVREAVEHAEVGALIRRIIHDEIVPGLDIDEGMARAFADDVLDRFANPFIRHELAGITFQQTAKMKVRVLPSLRSYLARFSDLPPGIVFGFASFLELQARQYTGGGTAAPDDHAGFWRSIAARSGDASLFVREVCASAELWENPLTELPGLTETLTRHVIDIRERGAAAALSAHLQSYAA